MNANELKEWIVDNDKVQVVLEDLGCQYIKYHSSGYWTSTNPDGDNKQAVTIYVPSLNVVNYTRNLPQPSDIFTLVEFYKDFNFFQALKYLHELLGLELYSDQDSDIPKSLQITKMMRKLKKGDQEDEDDTPVKPIPEIVLTYYKPYVNDFWKNDNVPYSVQKEWELMYDEATNRIVVPVRDEHSTLCGIKGRLFQKEIGENDLKFIYIEPCPRQKILYGLYKTMPYIKENGKIYIGEAEKFCHQLWAYGYKNCVATGGERISKIQIEKMIRLNVEIIFCLDKDVSKKKIESIAEQFPDGVPVYYMWDEDNILGEKEAPSDNPEKWKHLVENNIYRIK